MAGAWDSAQVYVILRAEPGDPLKAGEPVVPQGLELSTPPVAGADSGA